MKPQRKCCFIWIIQISLHYCRTAHDYLADIAVRHFAVVFIVPDHVKHIRIRQTDSAFLFTFFGHKARSGDTFRKPVALTDNSLAAMFRKHFVKLSFR